MDDSDISVDRNSVEDLSVRKECSESGESDVQALELSISDMKEQQKVVKFFTGGRDYKLRPNISQCSTAIS